MVLLHFFNIKKMFYQFKEYFFLPHEEESLLKAPDRLVWAQKTKEVQAYLVFDQRSPENTRTVCNTEQLKSIKNVIANYFL